MFAHAYSGPPSMFATQRNALHAIDESVGVNPLGTKDALDAFYGHWALNARLDFIGNTLMELARNARAAMPVPTV